MRISPENIEKRIRKAGDEYVEGEITEEELEEKIERALKLEYTCAELMSCIDFIRTPEEDCIGLIMGKRVPSNGTVRLDDIIDVDPLEQNVCPY